MSDYTLRIVTPQETVFEGNVESAVVPGEAGDLGVLANHAPLDTPVKPGRFTIKQDGEETHFEVGRGFFEVREDHATLLVTEARKV